MNYSQSLKLRLHAVGNHNTCLQNSSKGCNRHFPRSVSSGSGLNQPFVSEGCNTACKTNTTKMSFAACGVYMYACVCVNIYSPNPFRSLRETYRKDKTWGNKRNRKQKLLANLNYQNRQNIFAKLSKLLTEFSSVSQSCPTVCNPMDCSTPGLPVHHQLWEFTQTHVHWVGDAIQPSHPLSSPSPPAFNLS